VSEHTDLCFHNEELCKRSHGKFLCKLKSVINGDAKKHSFQIYLLSALNLNNSVACYIPVSVITGRSTIVDR